MDVTVSAKIEAKTEIPKQATGRAVNAVLDVISPFTEGMGLIGDSIRMQRADIALKIVERASEKLASVGERPKPLPNKFIVPLLEKASLETNDTSLIERWSDLLANASVDEKLAHPRFVQILSELTKREVEILHYLTLHRHAVDGVYGDWLSDKVFELSARMLNIRINNHVSKYEKAVPNDSLGAAKSLHDDLIELMNSQGSAAFSTDVSSDRGADERTEITKNPLSISDLSGLGSNENAQSLEILKSLNLIDINNVQMKNVGISKLYVFAEYVHLTKLGVSFVRACDKEAIDILTTGGK